MNRINKIITTMEIAEMKKKEIREMSSDEILRQQLELLAEKSKNTQSVKKLEPLTNAMIGISSLFYHDLP